MTGHTWTDADREFLIERLDNVLSQLLPRMSEDELRALLEERLKDAQDSYQDFLSMPDV
jgi:hypothetical protein